MTYVRILIAKCIRSTTTQGPRVQLTDTGLGDSRVIPLANNCDIIGTVEQHLKEINMQISLISYMEFGPIHGQYLILLENDSMKRI